MKNVLLGGKRRMMISSSIIQRLGVRSMTKVVDSGMGPIHQTPKPSVIKVPEIVMSELIIRDSSIFEPESPILKFSLLQRVQMQQCSLINFGGRSPESLLASKCYFSSFPICMIMVMQKEFADKHDTFLKKLELVLQSPPLQSEVWGNGVGTFVMTPKMMNAGCTKTPYGITAGHNLLKQMSLNDILKIDSIHVQARLKKWSNGQLDYLNEIKNIRCFDVTAVVDTSAVDKRKCAKIEMILHGKEIESRKWSDLNDLDIAVGYIPTCQANHFMEIKVTEPIASTDYKGRQSLEQPQYIYGCGRTNEFKNVITAKNEPLDSKLIQDTFGQPGEAVFVGISKEWLETKHKEDPQDHYGYQNVGNIIYYDFNSFSVYHYLNVLSGFSGMGLIDSSEKIFAVHSRAVGSPTRLKKNEACLIPQAVVDAIDNHYETVHSNAGK